MPVDLNLVIDAAQLVSLPVLAAIVGAIISVVRLVRGSWPASSTSRQASSWRPWSAKAHEVKESMLLSVNFFLGFILIYILASIE